MRTGRGSAFVLLLAVVLMLGGGLLAWSVRTDFGNVDVDRLRVVTSDGHIIGARLFRPLAATVAERAPGALLVHGYRGDGGSLVPYAVELVRRGYVVLALDRPAHGRRAAPVGVPADLGVADALDLLRSLDAVDDGALVLIGHGSGGDAVLAAAAHAEGAYAAIVLLGASPGGGTPEGAEALRNVALVVGRYDEFAPAAHGPTEGADARVRALFGTDGAIVAGEIHGSLEEGTGRILYTPPLTHHALLVAGDALAPTLDWAQRAAPPPRPLPPNDQFWLGGAVGSGMVMLAFVLALFGIAGVLLGSRAFGALRLRPAPAAGLRGAWWWLGAVVAAAVPAVTYVWAFERADELLGVTPLWPQPLTTGAVGWGVLNAGVALVVVLVWWLGAGRRRGARADTLGLQVGGFGRAVGLAVLVFAAAHALLAVALRFFGADARAWLVAQGPLGPEHAVAFAIYGVPAVLVFAVLGMLLHGQLRPVDARAEGADAMIANAFIASGGLLVLLAAQYLPLLTQERLPFGEPLLTIFAIELAVVVAVAAMLSTYLFARTGSVWPAALLNGAWVTGYLVAGGAMHAIS